MSWKNRKDEGILPFILTWLLIAFVALVIILGALAGVLWFIDWLPTNCGWVGILLFACVISYLFYKYE